MPKRSAVPAATAPSAKPKKPKTTATTATTATAATEPTTAADKKKKKADGGASAPTRSRGARSERKPSMRAQKKSVETSDDKEEEEAGATQEIEEAQADAEEAKAGTLNAESDASAEEASEDDDEESLLQGLDSDLEGEDEEDSSDDDDISIAKDKASVMADKLPTIAKDDKAVKEKLDKAKKKQGQPPGVLYIGRIPHGFYEKEMRSYFEQFGNVTRLRLSRNKKTGRSKHYAFIEFSSAAVAEIVQETMDNYLLIGHILRVKVVPPEKVHPSLWIGANRRYRAVPHDLRVRKMHNAPKTPAQVERVEKKLVDRQEKKRQELAKLGIDYKFEGYTA